MKAQVFGLDGKEKNEIELQDHIFGIKVSMGSIYNAVKNELANRRIGTASTKTRGEVRGRHQKMYRQKGTGRARAGTPRSPLRVGGGIVFGPKPRDYSYHIPKKIKRLAIRSIFSLKNKESRIKIIEDFLIENGKTKEMIKLLKKHVPEESTILILKEDNKLIKRAGSNIPWLKVLTYNRLNAHDLFYGKHLVLQETAANLINEFYT